MASATRSGTLANPRLCVAWDSVPRSEETLCRCVPNFVPAYPMSIRNGPWRSALTNSPASSRSGRRRLRIPRGQAERGSSRSSTGRSKPNASAGSVDIGLTTLHAMPPSSPRGDGSAPRWPCMMLQIGAARASRKENGRRPVKPTPAYPCPIAPYTLTSRGACQVPSSWRGRSAHARSWAPPSGNRAAGPTSRGIPPARDCNACGDGASGI